MRKLGLILLLIVAAVLIVRAEITERTVSSCKEIADAKLEGDHIKA